MSGFQCFLVILIFGQSLAYPSNVNHNIPRKYEDSFYYPEDSVLDKPTPQLAIYEFPENIIPEKDDRRVAEFAHELDTFHQRLTKAVLAHKPGENVIYSPISISILLMMIAFGSRGTTLNEIFERTGMEFDTQTLLGFYEIINIMKNIKGIDLELANVLFISDSVELVPDYRDKINAYLNSDIRTVDFTDPDLVAQQINDWCKNQTKNQITNIISPVELIDYLLVLANAVYFKGNWLKPFDVDNTRENVPFYVTKDTTVSVPMMLIQDDFNWGKITELDTMFIELPYTHEKNDKDFFSMYIFVPIQKDGLNLIEQNLHLIDFERLNLSEESVHLYLPKFEIESTLNMKPILEKMGLRTMFSRYADFRGLFENENLTLDKVVQKASLKVNEEGTVAAAVSVGGFTDRIAPSIITADRPFLCAIVLKSVGLPIFYARIVNPLK